VKSWAEPLRRDRAQTIFDSVCCRVELRAPVSIIGKFLSVALAEGTARSIIAAATAAWSVMTIFAELTAKTRVAVIEWELGVGEAA